MAIEIISVARANGAGCSHLVITANFDGRNRVYREDEGALRRRITGQENLLEAERLLTLLLVARADFLEQPLTGVKVPNPGDIATVGGGGGQTDKPGGGERP